jgi:hypothetical protein
VQISKLLKEGKRVQRYGSRPSEKRGIPLARIRGSRRKSNHTRDSDPTALPHRDMDASGRYAAPPASNLEIRVESQTKKLPRAVMPRRTIGSRSSR